jgi:hypothetical protein
MNIVVGNGSLKRGQMHCRQLCDMILNVSCGVLTSKCVDDEVPVPSTGLCWGRAELQATAIQCQIGACESKSGLHSNERTVRSDHSRWVASFKWMTKQMNTANIGNI